MIQAETMRLMATEQMSPHELAGWVVREGIMRNGLKYTQAARQWHISLPTLNRMMNGEAVSLMFYRVAERGIGLPWNLLDHVLNGDVSAVRAAPTVEGGVFDESLKADILREMSGGKPPSKRTTRRA